MLPNTVLIHATGWVKVPVQFLALAVVAKAENNQKSLKSPACSCVSITLPASSQTRRNEVRETPKAK